jgi:hypothetical protein
MARKEKFLLSYSGVLRMFILIIILFSTSFLPAELFSPVIILCGAFALFISSARIKRSLFNIIIPLLIILITGLTGILHYAQRHIYRDIAYALTPIALLTTGYWISEKSSMWTTFFRVLLLGGFIIALIHLSKFLLNPELFTTDIKTIRLLASNPNLDLVTLALILGLFRKKLEFGKLLPELLPGSLVIAILALSFILSFSRTGIVIFIVLTTAIKGYIGKINIKAILIFLLFAAFFIVLILTTPHDDVETFRGKIARSFREIVVKEYTTYRDININWRGHETWRALETYKSGNLAQKIKGHGFGAVVKLNMTMILAGEEFTEIPILHNGYAYILVKTGIIGILCYLVFYLNLLWTSHQNGRQYGEKEMLRRMLLGCTISLILTMFVIGGMAEIHNNEYVLLIGFLLRRMEQTDIVGGK